MTQTATPQETTAPTAAKPAAAQPATRPAGRSTTKSATPAPKGEAMTEHQNGSSPSSRANGSYPADKRAGRGGGSPRAGGPGAGSAAESEAARRAAAEKDRAERDKTLDMTLQQIQKRHGLGAIMKMSERTTLRLESIPTGALALDIALGIGGVPRGRVTEIYGPESSGKTTLALHIVAEAQKAGGVCAFIDAEHALDPVYASAIGVDIDNLLISQPDTGEQALDIADQLIRSGAVDVIVVDSVAALTPRAELEGEMGDSHVGLQARLMSQAMRKLTANLNKSRTTCVFINQLREKVGVMFGSPETTPGGRALKFYSSVRLDVRRIEAIKNGTEMVGNRTRAKVAKNKCAPPFRLAEFDIMYSQGISLEGSLLDVGVERGVVNKSGAWYTFEGEKLGQGKENAKLYLLENPELAAVIKGQILEIVFPKPERAGEAEAVGGTGEAGELEEAKEGLPA